MRGTVATVLLLVLFTLGSVWAGQRWMIYFPFGEVPPPADVGLSGAQEVSFTTDDALVLRGWYVPAASTPARFTVIVFNGNAGHRAMRAPLALALAKHGVASFLFDYRGYGANAGAPSEAGLARDARAARAYIVGRPDVDPSRLVYFGESLGAAVAVRLATEVAPLALVLRSPFTSLVDIGRHHYPFLPVRWLLRDRYPSIDLVTRVSCPILFVVGDRDSIVPAQQSERLYAAAPEPKRLVTIEGANHNDDVLLAGARVIGEVVGFVSAVGRR
ncbi:MAG: alpha/beta hydrolase [Gemmatimonadaceae bacterium]